MLVRHRLAAACLSVLFLLAAPLAAQPAAQVAPPALEAIQAEELSADLHVFAGDAMRGRAAGTLDELRGAAWIAQQAQAAGLEPAGQDGTFFQFFHVRRSDLSPASRVVVAGTPLAIGDDVIVPFANDATASGELIRYEPGAAVAGRVVVIEPPPAAELEGVREDMAAMQHFVNAVMMNLAAVIGGGAAAVIAVPDAVTAQYFDEISHMLGRGTFELANQESQMAQQLPIPLVVARPGTIPASGGAEFFFETVTSLYPSVNVVARAPGTDTRLAREHVLFSAHHDHDGVGTIDSRREVWNGADDNGSGSVALLAIGRAFADQPARRSALFVWHGAEERGLLGSRLFVQEPTIPREDIAAVLNADMIGRNHPDTTALLGAVPGNRNSRDLAEAALLANDSITRFVIDDSYDQPDHPERFWMRSDHFPYAMADIPALFFSTGLHPDYHTHRDTPDLIDYQKLERMARWIYATAWIVANADERPALDRR